MEWTDASISFVAKPNSSCSNHCWAKGFRFQPFTIEKSISVVSMEMRVDIDLSQKPEGLLNFIDWFEREGGERERNINLMLVYWGDAVTN